MADVTPSPEPVLETARLVLRLPRREDFEAWAAAGQDAEVMLHLGGTKPRFHAWTRFLANVGAWRVQGFAPFSVIEKTSDKWVGRIGPLHPEGWPGDEVGWTLAREAWGKGYATEAATAAIDWAFEVLGWTRVIHCIAPGNTASQAVARRLGSTLHGPGKLPPPRDNDPIDIWGQTREQWLSRRAERTAATPST